MSKSSARSYAEIESPAWRTIVRIFSSPVVRLLYLALYGLIIAPVGKLLRLNTARILPGRISLLAYNKGVGFREHTSTWNEQRTAEAEPSVQAVRHRAQWLRANITSDSQLVREKDNIVEAVLGYLKQNDGWTKSDDASELRLRCADALDRVDLSLRTRAVALVCEAIRREMDGIVLHDSQILACIALTDGYFIELRNGEGKTFVSVAVLAWGAIRVQALRRFAETRGIDAPFRTCMELTANNYLVRRDFVWLKKVYEVMGISVAYILSSAGLLNDRHLAYTADVLLMEGTEFGFDHLRNTCRGFREREYPQRPYLVLVDEADQLLLDEARTPLILSGQSKVESSAFVEAAWVVQVDRWVETIFGPNKLVEKQAGQPYGLTLAGRILLRSVLHQHGLSEWEQLRRMVESGTGVVLVQVVVQLLLEVPAYTKSLAPTTLTLLRRSSEGFGRVLDRDAQLGTLRLTPKAAELLTTSLGYRGVLLDLGPILSDLKDVLVWLVPQLRHAQLPPEDIRYLQNLGTYRLLSIARKILTSGRFVVEAIEALINEIAEGEVASLSADFAEGLSMLARGVSGEREPSDRWQLHNWLVFAGIPGIMNLILPTVESMSTMPKSKVHTDVVVLVRLYNMISHVGRLDYTRCPAAQRLVQQSAVMGALLQNLLYLTETGCLTSAGKRVAEFLEAHCRMRNLTERYSEGGVVDLIEKSLYAYCVQKRDRDYIVKDRRVVLVNQITGRQEPTKHFGRSLHPFVQAKHGLPIEEPVPTKRTVTVQRLMGRIPRLTGMSGTLVAEERALRELYAPEAKLPRVQVVPPHIAPNLKHEPLLLCATASDKWLAIAEDILRSRGQVAQPILVITGSVKDSKELSEVLTKTAQRAGRPIRFNVLNAEHEEMEEEIVSWAGQMGSVTIATQMAARGTDIVVTGEAINLGGLYVIIAEHHEATRLDHQAEGRAARHGDPGTSRYYMSLQDPLLLRLSAGVVEFMTNQLRDGSRAEVPPGPFYRMLQDGVLTVQEGIQFERQRHRRLMLEIDAVVDGYRDAAFDMRDLFVDGRPQDVASGIGLLSDIYMADVGAGGASTDLLKVTREIAHDITRDGLGADEILGRRDGQTRFTIPRTVLESIIDAYRAQQTPYVEFEGYQTPVSIDGLVAEMLVRAARESDLTSVSKEWEELVDRFELRKAFKPLRWQDLLHHLDRTLVLGFDWRAWAVAEECLSRLASEAAQEPVGISGLMRKAVIEAIETANPVKLQTSASSGAYRLQMMEPPQVRVCGIELSSLASDKAVQAIQQTASRLFADNEAMTSGYCREMLEAFDELWEQALDDLYLIEGRLGRAGATAGAWGALLRDVGNVVRRSITAIAHKGIDLLSGCLSEPLTQAPQRRTLRWLPLGVAGPAWFLDSVAGPDAPNDAAGPPGYEAYLEMLRQKRELAGDGQVAPEDISATAPGEQGASSPNVPYAILDILRHLSGDRQGRITSQPGLDELLCGEYRDGDIDLWLDQAESLRRERDGLAAAAYLDLVADPGRAARTRTLIFEAFGCHRKELEHLRILQAAGHLETRLKLRMTYLLGKGNVEERNEAVRLLLAEGVPDSRDGISPEDYSPNQALATALAQLVRLQRYDAAVGLLCEKRGLLAADWLDECGIIDSVGESLWRASSDSRRLFASAFGCDDWRQWLRSVYLEIYHRWRNADSTGLGELQSPGICGTLIRIALFVDDPSYVRAVLSRVLASGADASTWVYLASVFGSCGCEFEKHLFSARAAIINEDYERAAEETSWFSDVDRDDCEIRACRAYALIGLGRCLMDHRYGRATAESSLSECASLLVRSLQTEGDSAATELLLEAYCRVGDYAKAIDIVNSSRISLSPWRVHALLMERLPCLCETREVLGLLDSIAPRGLAENLELCHLLNRHLEQLRHERAERWASQDTLDLLTALHTRCEALLQDPAATYAVGWEVGVSSRLLADWLADAGDRVGASRFLRQAIASWNTAVGMTHDHRPPYASVLKREDRLVREEIEVALRRGLKTLKNLGSPH